MRILDRYVVKQVVPVWLWCLVVFMFMSCLIDLFEHLDEIIRFRIPMETVLAYYLNFLPFVFVRASPLALLLSAAFIASRLARHQELLAMNASGTSLLRAGVPFVFVGWLASLCVLAVNECLVPATSAAYEAIKREAFEAHKGRTTLENVAVIDVLNRLYHARTLDLGARELSNLTILEHDRRNRPTKSVYAQRAIWTKHGWLLLYGTISRLEPSGAMRGEPEPFVERLLTYPVTPESFRQPEAHPETMRFGQLRLLMDRLKQIGLTSVRRYEVELASKVLTPLMNLVVCLIAFAWSAPLQLRGNLRGLGLSLGWGLVYYVAVGMGEGLGKRGLLFLPAVLPVLAPHALAVWWSLRAVRRTA
jgi:lipopolysaccharide export system permease protein